MSLAGVALLLGSCAGGETERRASAARESGVEGTKGTAPEVDTEGERPTRQARQAPRLRCPSEATNCASARGRIIYVEEVDPDGDGDAHFVLESDEGITLPGITVVDVSARLRPDPLPGPGDYLSAIGPVYPGSYGQSQIEATAIRFTRVP